MPRIVANQLSAMKVAALIRTAERGYYSDGGGLWLQVSRYGTASWVYRYRMGGKVREAGLGSAKHIGLADARELAGAVRKKVILGDDHVAERQEKRRADRLAAATAKPTTFKSAADRYIAAHETSWRNSKHAAQWTATLSRYAYPVFGTVDVRDIDTALVKRALDPIWSTKPETASRVRGRIESVLDYAAVCGWREGENPARWKGHLEHSLPAPTKAKAAARRSTGRDEHHAALPYAELPAFMDALRQQEGVSARALELAILAAARTGDVLGARWDEINVAERLWIVPAERMKAGKEHRVPLSDAAMEIVNAMDASRAGDFVFPGARAGKPLSNMALLMTLRRMGRSDLTAHGFRSTFSDWCAEQTNTPSEVREMALAHAVGDKVEAAYRRGDLFAKRRQLMDAWGRYATVPAPAGDVVSLAERRA